MRDLKPNWTYNLFNGGVGKDHFAILTSDNYTVSHAVDYPLEDIGLRTARLLRTEQFFAFLPHLLCGYRLPARLAIPCERRAAQRFT